MSIPLINGLSEDGAAPWWGNTEPVDDERCAGEGSGAESELSFEDLTEEPAAGPLRVGDRVLSRWNIELPGGRVRSAWKQAPAPIERAGPDLRGAGHGLAVVDTLATVDDLRSPVELSTAAHAGTVSRVSRHGSRIDVDFDDGSQSRGLPAGQAERLAEVAVDTMHLVREQAAVKDSEAVIGWAMSCLQR